MNTEPVLRLDDAARRSAAHQLRTTAGIVGVMVDNADFASLPWLSRAGAEVISRNIEGGIPWTPTMQMCKERRKGRWRHA